MNQKNRSELSLPSRRDFVTSSCVALTSLLGVDALGQGSPRPDSAEPALSLNHFDFGKQYSSSATKRLLAPSNGAKGASLAAPTGIPFWVGPHREKIGECDECRI